MNDELLNSTNERTIVRNAIYTYTFQINSFFLSLFSNAKTDLISKPWLIVRQLSLCFL